MLKKIISGGNTGAERAAIDAAIDLGIPYTGWIQNGRMTDGGILPNRYRLNEAPPSETGCTERNIIESDGTLILSHGKLTGESALPAELADKHKRPLLHIDLEQIPAVNDASVIYRWMNQNNVKDLNVTGSREIQDPAIYGDAKRIIANLYYYPLLKGSPPELSGNKNKYPTISDDPSGDPKRFDDAIVE